MSEHLSQTISEFQQKLRQQEQQVADTKRLINLLCQQAGTAPLYPEADINVNSPSGIRSDQFYGRPLATVIQEFLAMRKATGQGAATVAEIHEALTRGGYKWDVKNDENAKRGLYVSLGKNLRFHRLPTGAWGLREWYPSARVEKDDDESRKPIGRKVHKKRSRVDHRASEVESHEDKESGKKPEKGAANEEGQSAVPAARTKHNPTPEA